MELIKANLKPKDKLEAIKYGYYEMMRGVPYNKFKQTGVLGGAFNGVKIIPGFFTRLLSYFLRVLEVRNRTELKAFLVDLRKVSSRF